MPNIDTTDERKATMKLSEAIKEGAKLRPQGFGSAIDRTQQDTSCALEAATEFLTGDRAGWLTGDFRATFGLHNHIYAQCPACAYPNALFNLSDSILHLNDNHRWTREEIADWVATLEK